jgi:hypothetical protein
MDSDYIGFMPGGACTGYNYLDPNYMPASWTTQLWKHEIWRVYTCWCFNRCLQAELHVEVMLNDVFTDNTYMSASWIHICEHMNFIVWVVNLMGGDVLSEPNLCWKIKLYTH